MTEVLIQAVHPHYVAGLVVREGRVVACAPILMRRVLGALWQEARNRLVSTGAVLHVVSEVEYGKAVAEE